MSWPLIAYTALACLALSGGARVEARTQAPAAGLTAEAGAVLDAVMTPLVAPTEPGAVVAVYQKGQPVVSRAYGLADLDHRVPNTPGTIFNLASVSKQFTAFSIALLAREGKVDLNADIREYLPRFPDVGARVTVAHLVHHLSGVPDYVALAELGGHEDNSLIHQVNALAIVERQRSLNFVPGTECEYSNSGYVLLAEIVRSVTGKGLGEFMQERIFAPLKMADTRVHAELGWVEPNYAMGYEPRNDAGKWSRSLYQRETVGPGNLLSNVGDLVKWAENFLHPTVGDAALIGELIKPVALSDGTPVSYGYGVAPQTIAGRRAISHTGSVSGYRSILVVFPDDELAVVALANRPLDLKAVTGRIVSRLLGTEAVVPSTLDTVLPATARAGKAEGPSKAATTSAPLTRAELAQLAGDYHSDAVDATYTLQIDGGNVVLSSLWWREPAVFKATGRDRFDSISGPLKGLSFSIERTPGRVPAALLINYDSVKNLRAERVKR